MSDDPYIVVQTSPRRWAVAVRTATANVYRVITGPMDRLGTATLVAKQLNSEDERDYSELTREYLINEG